MLDVKIYGTSTPGYQLARAKLKEALENAGIRYTFHEITQIPDIIRDQVESVPAIRLNDTFLFEIKTNGHYNQSLRETIQKVLQMGQYGHMTKIIVPTDFSDASFAAYNFANHLARLNNGVLWLTHVYKPIATDIQQLVDVNEPAERMHEEKLRSYVASLNQDWIGNFITEPLVEGVFRVGFPAIELEVLSRTNNAVMVMGTTGADDTMKKVFGSLSVDLSGVVSCPLFLIPPGATFPKMQRVLFLTEELSLDTSHLLYVAGLSSRLGLPLTIMHFRTDDKTFPLKETVDLLEAYYPELDYMVDVTDTQDVLQSIASIIAKDSIHLVGMSKRNRGFFTSLFHKSVSDFAAVHTRCPLLILDDKVKKKIEPMPS